MLVYLFVPFPAAALGCLHLCALYDIPAIDQRTRDKQENKQIAFGIVRPGSFTLTFERGEANIVCILHCALQARHWPYLQHRQVAEETLAYLSLICIGAEHSLPIEPISENVYGHLVERVGVLFYGIANICDRLPRPHRTEVGYLYST